MPTGADSDSVATAIALLTSQVANLSTNILRMEGRIERAAQEVEAREQKKLDAITSHLEQLGKCINDLEKSATEHNINIKTMQENIEALERSEKWWKIALAVGTLIALGIGIYK